MTPEQIDLVQNSFSKVVPIKQTAGQLFYKKLFELDPSVKPLFPDNLDEQIGKLMATIGLAVGALKRLDTIVPAVQELGRKHVGYGVKDEHYDTVGAALLWTLEQGLGKDFTPEVKQAWTDCYVLLATTMKDAARTASAA